MREGKLLFFYTSAYHLALILSHLCINNTRSAYASWRQRGWEADFESPYLYGNCSQSTTGLVDWEQDLVAAASLDASLDGGLDELEMGVIGESTISPSSASTVLPSSGAAGDSGDDALAPSSSLVLTPMGCLVGELGRATGEEEATGEATESSV